MVTTPKILSFQILFLARRPVVILVATDDDFIGDTRGSGLLFECAKLTWFFFLFLFPFSFLGMYILVSFDMLNIVFV